MNQAIYLLKENILEGKFNGKIKEYNRVGVIIFEGEYINGKRNGYGKEYNDSGILKFEGEYLNGKKWDGKGYDTSNNVLYELKDGMGIIIENINDFYEYIEGEVNGNAKFSYNSNCQSFEGEYLKGKKNGKGKEYILKKIIFEGEYKDGKRNGKGREYYYNEKLKFEGEYINNKRNGKGKEYYNNGNLKFEGEYLNGKIWNGKGHNKDNKIE